MPHSSAMITGATGGIGRAISGALSGHLDLELLQPFLGAVGIDRLGGDLRAELTAGGGYFTELLARTVGASGRVLYSLDITAPYAPAVMKATRSPASSGGNSSDST